MPKEETVLIGLGEDEIEINKKVFEDFEDFVRSKYGRIDDELLGKEILQAIRIHMEFKKTESSE